MTLRDYQVEQSDFLYSRLQYTGMCGLESPTGSGKSFVMMDVAKKWLDDHPTSQVTISTGFNRLIFDLEKTAREYGLNPVVLMGTKGVNCPVEWEEKYGHDVPFKVFTLNAECNCGRKHYSFSKVNGKNEESCPFSVSAYQALASRIKSGECNLVITNHSTFLAHQDSGTFAQTELLLVDEAHTFATFYSSYMDLTLDSDDLEKISKAVASIRPPMGMIIKRNINAGVKLPKQQVDALVEKLDGYRLKHDAEEFFSADPAPNIFIERSSSSFIMHRFYRDFAFLRPKKIILVSATLDSFTRTMFGVSRSNVYVERKQFVDYTKSEFVGIPREEFAAAFGEFLEICDNHGYMHGLCLSTTITDMNIALGMDGTCGYHMISDPEEFKMANPDEKVVLCGSRGLFQGIDLPSIQFVCLNKLPFPTWNDCARAEQNYLTNNGKNGFDAWKGYTVPKVENDIIQSTGRLWRSPNDFGLISIFDSRLEKFGYMIRDCFHIARHGIEIKIKREGEKKECWKFK